MPPKGQPDYRRTVTAKDQFGRAWSVCIEIATGDPCGLISVAGWSDHLRTPNKYLSVPKDEFGQPAWGKMYVDIPRWIADQTEAERLWRVALWQIGQQKLGVKFDAKGAEEDEYLLHLVGPKPWPTSETLLAALAGDRALLGLEPLTPFARKMLGIVTLDDLVATAPKDAQPAMATEIQALSYRDFVSALSKQGKKLDEIAELWRTHKAALKETPQEA